MDFWNPNLFVQKSDLQIQKHDQQAYNAKKADSKSQKRFKFSILERALIGLIASKLRFRVNCWKNYLSQCTLWLMHFRPAMILQMSSTNNMCLFSKVRFFFSVLSSISAFVLRSSAIYLPNWKIIAVEGVERDFWVTADVLQRTGRHRFFPPWPSSNIFPVLAFRRSSGFDLLLTTFDGQLLCGSCVIAQ